jgi:hypothetical protein
MTPATPSSVESAYLARIDAMPPYEKVARATALFQWTREQFARQILATHGPVNEERLKWLVALRLYGASPTVRRWIEGKLADVSG